MKNRKYICSIIKVKLQVTVLSQVISFLFLLKSLKNMFWITSIFYNNKIIYGYKKEMLEELLFSLYIVLVKFLNAK